MAMDIGKLILVAVGGFVAYEWFIAPSTTTTTTTTTTPPATPPPATTPAPTAAQQQQAAANVSTQGLIAALMGKEVPPLTSATADQMGYFYSQARGVAAPNPGSYLTDSTAPQAQSGYLFTLPEWCSDSGLCGLSGIVPMERGFSDYRPAPRLAIFNEE
jgi:hypothetical protein